ncbi:hypothetical protein J7E93_00385 [Streptomyces sp. ISL-36]|uniref:hypothetical protein n=1 Tax=Streptomyces sp. ISL-36 TaxID=2819182 RepID=UPI001BEBDCA9|nr:hypothetical protein [Streptomyces sp. ISL-36]MBT2438608.1 hypothetical protein [Streptomyces sp. ISL-36]
MDASVMTVVIVAALLVCRSAVLEMREPGAGRRAWAFLRDRRALGAGLTAALLLGGFGWGTIGAGAVPWACLAGVLVASVSARRRTPGE